MSAAKSDRKKYSGGAHAATASALERDTQFQKYHNQRAGHGFAAEDANALNDALSGKKVEKIGLDNALNGADRVVDGVAIQTKYYSSAENSVNAAFDANGFRYRGQRLEVPKDQYESSIKVMQEKIKQGLVRDAQGNVITDPDAAESIIQKGSVTYEQARNIAKAGNIDSLIFDARNNTVTTLSCGGISFIISFARYSWDGASFEDATKAACSDALAVGGISFVTGVLSSQLLRTKTAAAATIMMRPAVKAIYRLPLDAGKNAIEAIASASLGRTVSGAAAINHVSKLLRSNVITAGVTTVVTMTPDVYRAMFQKNMSWGQVTKNLLVNIGGVAGGTGGWIGGAAAGAAAGSLIPGVGTMLGAIAGGIGGALLGGSGGAVVVKKGVDALVKDDAEEMLDIVYEITEDLAFDYLLSENEVERLRAELSEMLTLEWLRKMYAAGNELKIWSECRSFAMAAIKPIVQNIASERKALAIDDALISKTLLDALDQFCDAEENTVASSEQAAPQPAIKEKNRKEAIWEIIEKHFKPIAMKKSNKLFLKTHSENFFPMKKVYKGLDSFGHCIDIEDVLVYYDSTMFGGGDEGFIFTEDILHYKQLFADSTMVFYSDMNNITEGRTNFTIYDGADDANISCVEDNIRKAAVAALKDIRRFLRSR